MSSCIHVPSAGEQLATIRRDTGLEPVNIEGAGSEYLGKTHRGYQILFRIKAGDVWGRYAARVAVGETGRELGGIWSFLSGSYQSGVGGVVGSPFDRLLSQLIGQPLSLMVILKHEKTPAPRLDIVNQFATLQPPDPQPEIQYIGLGAGTLYSNDVGYAKRILADKKLLERIENFRSQYVRVDDQHVAFVFAGSENDYSAMIRSHDNSYSQFINAILDSLADLADKL